LCFAAHKQGAAIQRPAPRSIFIVLTLAESHKDPKMKFHLLTVSFLLSCSLHAQVAKSQILAGLSIGGYRTVSGSTDSTFSNNFFYESSVRNESMNVPIHVGYMVSGRMAVGFTGGYSYTNSSQRFRSTSINNVITWNENARNSKRKVYSAGAFGRYYLPVGARWFLFLNASGNISKGQELEESTTSNSNGAQSMTDTLKVAFSEYGVLLSAGATYFVTKRVGIELQSGHFGYVMSETSTYRARIKVATNNNQSLSFQNFFFPRLGVSFYFGGTKPGGVAAGK
jgi:hypothetical protein